MNDANFKSQQTFVSIKEMTNKMKYIKAKNILRPNIYGRSTYIMLSNIFYRKIVVSRRFSLENSVLHSIFSRKQWSPQYFVQNIFVSTTFYLENGALHNIIYRKQCSPQYFYLENSGFHYIFSRKQWSPLDFFQKTVFSTRFSIENSGLH